MYEELYSIITLYLYTYCSRILFFKTLSRIRGTKSDRFSYFGLMWLVNLLLEKFGFG